MLGRAILPLLLARAVGYRLAVRGSAVVPLRTVRAAPPRLEQDDGAFAAAREALSLRVRKALLDEEEKPYTVWSQAPSAPLRANLDLLLYRARVLRQKRDFAGARETLRRCTQLDANDGRAWLALSKLEELLAEADYECEKLGVMTPSWTRN